MFLWKVLEGTVGGPGQGTTSLHWERSSAKAVYLWGPAQGRRKHGNVMRKLKWTFENASTGLRMNKKRSDIMNLNEIFIAFLKEAQFTKEILGIGIECIRFAGHV
ncbi:hypothetical protein [Alkaliphilus peptidifermentans]|nr:hypothetical protein [Alkaliphilus peptidifermentans]